MDQQLLNLLNSDKTELTKNKTELTFSTPKIYIKRLSNDEITDLENSLDNKNSKNVDSIINNIFSSFFNKTSKKKEDAVVKLPENLFKIDETTEYEEIDINKTSNGSNILLNDLITLGKSYTEELKNKYAFDFEKLYNIVPYLEELNETIGMESIKKNIVSQVIYFLLNLENKHGMMNTAIYGNPGVGKTLVGSIIGNIYNKLGLVPNSNPSKNAKLKVYKASMLIGEYLGHTRKKTRDAINECINSGSIMFLDEAYSLSSGNKGDKGDSYGYESIDELCIALSENPNFILIIAGYEEELEKRFFALNKGLNRRFPFRYKIDKYDHLELCKIFLKKIKDDAWKYDESINLDNLNSFFKTNIKAFPAYGGSIDELFFNVKMCHGIRIFGKKPNVRKTIIMDDIEKGFQKYKKVKNIKEDDIVFSMYS